MQTTVFTGRDLVDANTGYPRGLQGPAARRGCGPSIGDRGSARSVSGNTPAAQHPHGACSKLKLGAYESVCVSEWPACTLRPLAVASSAHPVGWVQAQIANENDSVWCSTTRHDRRAPDKLSQLSVARRFVCCYAVWGNDPRVMMCTTPQNPFVSVVTGGACWIPLVLAPFSEYKIPLHLP
eukprot:2542608-Amphidinium_carterae.1